MSGFISFALPCHMSVMKHTCPTKGYLMAEVLLFGVLEEIAIATDEETARLIGKVYGGRQIQIPLKHFDVRNPIVRLIGAEKTRAIANYFGWRRIDIPQAGLSGTTARRQLLIELVKQGLTAKEIIKKTGYSERQIRRYRGGVYKPQIPKYELPKTKRRLLLEELLNAGVNVGEVADKTGYAKDYVCAVKRKLGLSPTNQDQIKRRLKLKELIQERKTVEEISQLTGYTKTHIRHTKKKLGFGSSEKAKSVRRTQCERLLKDGCTVEEIVHKTGLSLPVIQIIQKQVEMKK